MDSDQKFTPENIVIRKGRDGGWLLMFPHDESRYVANPVVRCFTTYAELAKFLVDSDPEKQRAVKKIAA